MEGSDNTTYPLISAEEVAHQLFDLKGDGEQEFVLKTDLHPKLKLIDASLGGDAALQSFKERAIPTSRFLDVVRDLKDKNGRFPNTFPPKEVVLELAQNLGLNIDDEIILYSQPGKTVGSTRSYVVLTSYGFRNVKILDGGLKRYTDLGYPTQEGQEHISEKSTIADLSDFKPQTSDISEVVAFALGRLPDYQVIDTRPTDAYNGEATDNVDGCRQGHVAGSINIPMSEFFTSDQAIKSDEEIKEIIEKYRVDPHKKTIMMCRTGMTATVGYVALRKYADTPFESIKLYDGSWSEYGSI